MNCSHNTIHQLFLNVFAKRASFLNVFANRARERQRAREREREEEREREREREREGESERARENVKNHQCKQPSFPQNAILKIDYRLGSTDPLKKKTDKK